MSMDDIDKVFDTGIYLGSMIVILLFALGQDQVEHTTPLVTAPSVEGLWICDTTIFFSDGRQVKVKDSDGCLEIEWTLTNSPQSDG